MFEKTLFSLKKSEKLLYNNKTTNNVSDMQNNGEEISENKFNNNHLDNLILIISEIDNKVYLPYKISEINDYLEQYSDIYTSFEDVIEKEFILSLDYYIKHPTTARFREAYSLIRDKEGKSVVDALSYAFNMMFKYELNPTIIAACKTQEQLDDYIDCLENEKLDQFNHFKIEFRINPLKA